MNAMDGEDDGAPRSSGNLVRVSLAEDDGEMRAIIAEELRKHGYDVREAVDGDQMIELLRSVRHAPLGGAGVIVMDVQLPEHTGMELLAVLRSSGWSNPVILITAFGDPKLHAEALALGALVIDRPLDLDELRAAIQMQSELLHGRGPASR
jgi:two-component system, response regulator, stage 0 sporulation protein F